jgi:hypothetical protein
MACIWRDGPVAVTSEGESELVRGGEESATSVSESWPLEKKSVWAPSLSNILGLSLPVGPLPKGGRVSGGQPTIFLRRAFSVSSSDTLCSRAYNLQR